MSYFNTNNLKIEVSAASGIEAVTKREIEKLGYTPGGANYGRICFFGGYRDLARANMYLRTANRVRLVLAEFHAENFDELFDGVNAIPFEDILPQNAKIIVNAKSIKSTLFGLSAIQSISKKAVLTRLMQKRHNTVFSEDGNAYALEVSLILDEVTVTLDTSGQGLHKRGYRTFVGEAPMRETMAAAIIQLSVWNPSRPLIDPFCGSGTIPLEAAMIATNTAPGLKRDFAMCHFDFAPNVMDGVREEAQSLIDTKCEVRISGFDINPKAVSLCNVHAERSGMKDLIHFQVMDMRSVSSHYENGVIITNPPYGERLMEAKELTELYRDFGKMYRSLPNWCCYAITSFKGFEKYFGQKAAKTRKMYNSELECILYQYLGERPNRR